MAESRRRSARSARSRRVRVVIADDHRTFAESLRIALDVEPDIAVTAVCEDGTGVVQAVRDRGADVVLMDVRMPGLDGVAATRALREAFPETRVVALSAVEDEEWMGRAVEAGAVGFLSKSVPLKEVARAVRAAAGGEQLLEPGEISRLSAAARRRREQEAGLRERVGRLSRRETEILQRMAEGGSPDTIARSLGISRHTFRTHVQNILFKLKVHSKVEALAAAVRYGKVRATEDAEP